MQDAVDHRCVRQRNAEGNQMRELALGTMDDQDLQARSEQALVVITLSTATLIACVGLLISTSVP